MLSDPHRLSQNQKLVIAICVMLVAVIEVLDMTIVNVALPNMMGQLGADTDQITWVLTSYIVASAIFMPLTGLLVKWLGRKNLLLINIAGFLLSSMLCGASQSLTQIVSFRILQGVFGASLVPLSQFILRDTYEPHEQSKAMAIWGIGIMTAPVLGPTLGGYIAENLTWRWVFYLNVPVCVIAFLMALRVITNTPREKIKLDFLGLILLFLGIGCLQIFLDRGNSADWYSSDFITALTCISVVSLIWFIVRGIRLKDNIINLHLFRDRNFSACMLLLTFYCLGVISTVALQPMMLEMLMHYSAFNAGLLLAPRGIASAIAMMFCGVLVRKTDARLVIALGILLSAFGTYMMSWFNLYVSFDYMIWPGIIQGIGMGLFFVPLSTCAFMTLKQDQIAEASGIFSFGRSLGSSIGISLLITLLTREGQINWNRLGGYLYQSNDALQHWLHVKHLSWHSPNMPAMLASTLEQQAHMVAFNDAFWITAIAYLLILPLPFFISKMPANFLSAGGAGGGAH